MQVGLLSGKGGGAEVRGGKPSVNDDPRDNLLTCLPHISCLLREFNRISSLQLIERQSSLNAGFTAAETDSPPRCNSMRSTTTLRAEINSKTRVRGFIAKVKQTYLKELECNTMTKWLWRIQFGLRHSHVLSDTSRAVKHALQVTRSDKSIGGKYNYYEQLHDKSNTTAVVLYHLSQVYEVMMLCVHAILYFDHPEATGLHKLGPDEFNVWKILSNEPPEWIHETDSREKLDKQMRKRLMADYKSKTVDRELLFHPGWLAMDVPFLWLPFIDRQYSNSFKDEIPALKAHLDGAGLSLSVDEAFGAFLLQLDSLFDNWSRDVSEMRTKILGVMMTAFLTLMQYVFHRMTRHMEEQ